MTIYIVQGRYSQQALKGLVAKPEDREAEGISALPVPSSTTRTPGAISLPSVGLYSLTAADAAETKRGAAAAPNPTPMQSDD